MYIAREMTGYLSGKYAQALDQIGAAVELFRSGGWVLARPIPGADFKDAMGCYPVFSCRDWSKLPQDFRELEGEFVSIVLVTDPFGNFDPVLLRDCFTEIVKPFKRHLVVDLSRPMDSFVHPHHLRNARKGLRLSRVERCEAPVSVLDHWTALYNILIERHEITGITRFSRESFARQMSVPGLEAFRAVHADETIGMLLCYIMGDVAYYHLGAFSDTGYRRYASFALFAFAIEYFTQLGVRWLSLGAGPGMDDDRASGLVRFKQGWSTGTRTAYLCGHIFAPEKYAKIVEASGGASDGYFPAYRSSGEFD